MTREFLTLNAEKLKHLIEQSGKQKKTFLLGMRDRRTLSRILRGDTTTRATAEGLAKDLGVTVEDLQRPVSDTDLFQREPDQWLYDDIPRPLPNATHLPASPILRGQGYIVGRSPIGFMSPLLEVFNLNRSRSRRVVLRKEHHAYTVEVHFFHYRSDDQHIECRLTTGCRFFPLARKDDSFSKTALTAEIDRYVWRSLKSYALQHADVLQVEDQLYPDHPGKYLPLVRFFEGPVGKRKLIGARFYNRFHSELRSSLISYLREIAPTRIRAKTTFSGIAIVIEPNRPPNPTIGWRENVQVIAVDLVWKDADQRLEFAPWREDDRNTVVEAINTKKWVNIYSPNLPLYVPEWADDDEPKLEPDPDLSIEDVAALHAMPAVTVT